MIRFAETADQPQLKTLFAEAFGDPDELIDAFFAYRHANENMLVEVRDGMVAGMLSMLPFMLDVNGGQSLRARYIYAVATRKLFRRQGIAGALLNAAHAHMQRLGEAAAVLVPATPELFAYYGGHGYAPAFSIDLLHAEADSLPALPRQASHSACSSKAYTMLRNQAFSDRSLFVRWDESAVAYTTRTFVRPCGLIALSWENGNGCAAWETAEDGVLVKELVLLHGNTADALSVLHHALGAARYTVRLAQDTVPNGTAQPFGMIRWLAAPPPLSGKPPYLSLAMD